MARNMPSGVEVAGIGQRVAAWLIDYSVPLALNALIYFVILPKLVGTALIVSLIAFALVMLAWTILQWWAYATRGAGLGYRAMKLQLVGLHDGKPIGWWRFFIRQLVFSAIAATLVGWILLLVFLVIQERRQGWHDMSGQAIAIRATKAIRKTSSRTAGSSQRSGPSTTVALPPHLIAAAFDGRQASQNTAERGPDPAQQAWQANQYGQQGPTVQTGWRPPAAPGSTHQDDQPRRQAPDQPQQHGQQNYQPQQGYPSSPGSQGSASQPWQQPGGQQSGGQYQQGQQAWGQQQPQQQSQQQGQQPQSQSSASQWAGQSSWAPPADESAETSVRVRPRGENVEEDEYGGTRMVARPGASAPARPGQEGWFVLLDDGRQVMIDKTLILGRNPSGDGNESTLVTFGEGGHAVSKVHMVIGVDQRGVHITDRGSTNGTALVNLKGELDPLLPGIQARCREGQIVSFGDRSLTIMRKPAGS